jgi:hypothetical protein
MKTSSHTILRSLLTPIALGLLVPVTMTAYTGCKKDEPPPPLPSAAPTPTPSAPLQLVVEDAAPEAGDADADAKKKIGTGVPSSLSRCCSAIAQNAANAPEPTATYMKQFAAACSAAAKTGNTAGVQAAARSAGVACK